MNAPSTSNPVDPKVAQALRRQRSKEAAQKARLRKEDELRALQAQVAQLRREKRSLQIALDKQCAHSQHVMERVTILVARHKALAAANVTLQSHLARAQELFPELQDHLPPMPHVEDPSYLPDAGPCQSPRAPSPLFHHFHPLDDIHEHHHQHTMDPMAIDASDATESISTAPTAVTARPPGLVVFTATPRTTPHCTAPSSNHPTHSGASHDDYHPHSHHIHPHHPDSPSPDPSSTIPSNAATRSTSSAPPSLLTTVRVRPSAGGPSPFNPSGHRVTLGRPSCSDSQDSAGATTTLQRRWSGNAPYPVDHPAPPHNLCSLEGVASTSSYLTRPSPSPVQINASHSDSGLPQHESAPSISLPTHLPCSALHVTPTHDRSNSPSCRAPPPRRYNQHHHSPPSLNHVTGPCSYDPSYPQPPSVPFPAPPGYSNGHRSRSYPEHSSGNGRVSQTSTEPSSCFRDTATQDTHGTHDDYPPLNDPPSFNLSTLLTLSSTPLAKSPRAAEPLAHPTSTFSACNPNHQRHPGPSPSLLRPLSPAEPLQPYHQQNHHNHHPRQPQTMYRSHADALPSVNSLVDIPTLDPADPYIMPSVPSLQVFGNPPPTASTPSPWPHAYPDNSENGDPHPTHDDDQFHYPDQDEGPYHSSHHGNSYQRPEFYTANGSEPYPPSQDGPNYPVAHQQMRSSSRQMHPGPEWPAQSSPSEQPAQQISLPGSRAPGARQPHQLFNQRTRLQQLVWTTDQ